MSNIIAVYSSYQDGIEAIKNLMSKGIRVSVGIKGYLKCGLKANDPYFEYKNNRWCIELCNGYMCYTPYSIIAQNYLDKSKRLRK